MQGLRADVKELRSQLNRMEAALTQRADTPKTD